MGKIAIPALLMKQLIPEWPYFVVFAAAGVIGHNWPVYYRFKGGRGASPVMGGLLVLDPLGLVAVMLSGSFLGLTIGHMLFFRWSWIVLTLPWFWLRTRSWLYVGYALVCNIAYWTALIPEIRKYSRLKSHPSQEQLSTFFTMGAGIGRWMDHYSLLALIRRSHTAHPPGRQKA
jgi:glycerol-3-phosphate acyltransferase PlsY